jgi:hypothetical protein
MPKATLHNQMNAYDQEGQSLRRNHLLFNQETRAWVEFLTQKQSADRNDVIHNATGPAVRFGRTCNPATNPETPNPQPDTMPTTMSNRYKIFQVERSQFGPLPGEARIELSSNTISAVLSDELSRAVGSAAFGVECDTFAWFEDGPIITLILREEDHHFNIDLAMTHLANLPGKEEIDLFSVIEARITRRKRSLDSILRKRGVRPIFAGGALPHQGMGGTVYRGGGVDPVFAAPPLPTLVGQPGDAGFDGLIDIWFRQLKTILEILKARFVNIKLVLQGGGDVRVPAWFKEWCVALGIDIEFVDGEGGELTPYTETSRGQPVFGAPPPPHLGAALAEFFQSNAQAVSDTVARSADARESLKKVLTVCKTAVPRAQLEDSLLLIWDELQRGSNGGPDDISTLFRNWWMLRNPAYEQKPSVEKARPKTMQSGIGDGGLMRMLDGIPVAYPKNVEHFLGVIVNHLEPLLSTYPDNERKTDEVEGEEFDEDR